MASVPLPIWLGSTEEVLGAICEATANLPIDGTPPLAIALLRAVPDLSVAVKLVAAGADPNARLPDGRTILEAAQSRCDLHGDVKAYVDSLVALRAIDQIILTGSHVTPQSAAHLRI